MKADIIRDAHSIDERKGTRADGMIQIAFQQQTWLLKHQLRP